MKHSKRYQKTANKICQKHGLSPIPIFINRRLKAFAGLFCNTHIELANNQGKSTLLHELAHYLEDQRFHLRVKGYYKMEMWPSMEPCQDKLGWFSATGPLAPVCFKVGRMHGMRFQQCLKDIAGNSHEYKWIKYKYKR